MAATATQTDPRRQRLLDAVARRTGAYDYAQQGGGDRGTASMMLNLARKALADYDAKAKAPAAAKPVTPAGATVSEDERNRYHQDWSAPPPPAPAAPKAVTDPEAAVAPTIAGANDRAGTALQQPIAAQPGEDEAVRQRRKLAERNFLARITGVLTGVGGVRTASSQVGTRSLLGGTA